MNPESFDSLFSDLGKPMSQPRSERSLDQLVDTITERLSLVFLGIYLVDETGEWAILRAGSGEAGRKMRACGHKCKVAPEIPIGRTILSNELWVVDSAFPPKSEEELAQGSEIHEMVSRQASVTLRYVRKGPELFFTPAILARWELVFPLRQKGRAIGAMVANSDQVDDFGGCVLVSYQRLADWISAAIGYPNAVLV